jgi:hypothetical protein
MVMFQGLPKMKNYRYQTLDFKALRTRLWTEEMRELWLWNAVINLSGQQGKGIAIDEFNEWVVRAVKDIYNPTGSMQSTKFTCETISPNVISLREAAKGVLRSSGAPTWGYNHARVDDKRDIELIVEQLLKDDIFTFTPGRPSPITYKASRDRYMDAISPMTGSEGVVKKYVAKKVAQQAGIFIEEDLTFDLEMDHERNDEEAAEGLFGDNIPEWNFDDDEENNLDLDFF